jgi:hypothetical protein
VKVSLRSRSDIDAAKVALRGVARTGGAFRDAGRRAPSQAAGDLRSGCRDFLAQHGQRQVSEATDLELCLCRDRQDTLTGRLGHPDRPLNASAAAAPSASLAMSATAGRLPGGP